MIGIVLAAGAGRRLAPLTDGLPKTLLEVAGTTTILETTLGNLRDVGIRDVVVVTGVAAERIDERVPLLEQQYGVSIECVYNDRAAEWNNAYSLWVARSAFADGALLVNGDTVHPAGVERTLLAHEGAADLVLATDTVKVLGDEEMKVLLADDGALQRINKAIDPPAAHGEAMGVALIRPAAAGPLADALERTWRRDPTLYYEDGFQQLVDDGFRIEIAPIGSVAWVEVDNHDDLRRAREVTVTWSEPQRTGR